jgi:thiosulfate/3-mercaptopyruvate sulfurtransferase
MEKTMRMMKAWTGLALLCMAAGAAADPLLVTPRWLAEHLDDKDLVLLHVGPREEYDAGHIRGARYVGQRDVSAEQKDPKGLSLEMSDPDRLREQLQALGISDHSRIVVYFGKDWVSPTTRIIFTLDAANLGKNTSMLDGGMPLWLWESRPLSKEPGPATRGTLSPLSVKPLVVDAQFVQAHKGQPGYALIDGRSADFYTGAQTSYKKGHIPGAASVPFDTISKFDGTLKPPEQLRAMFTEAGVKPGDTIIGYCHIGQQGTAMLFAARSLGYKVVLYDGSFEDWTRRDLPVE